MRYFCNVERVKTGSGTDHRLRVGAGQPGLNPGTHSWEKIPVQKKKAVCVDEKPCVEVLRGEWGSTRASCM
jgi:hypothetical protein